MEIFKLLSASEILAQVITFLVLLWVMRVFFWKRILKVLDDRRQSVSSEIKSIGDQKIEVDRLKNEYEARLAKIDEEAKARVQEALGRAEVAAEALRKEAQAEGEKIVEDAKKSLKYEIASAKQEFRQEIIDLVIGATQEVLEQKITQSEDKRIVEDFIDKVDKA